jgi:secondary thiamine-phosphate synthase enzyme
MIETTKFCVESAGNCDIIDITCQIERIVAPKYPEDALASLFVVGSTAALSTVEYEPGLVKSDLKAAFQKLAPENDYYEHEKTWHDDNGHSHVRATLLGPSLTVPIEQGKLILGTWQQIILVDFDTRPRSRTVICQIIS